MNKHTATDPAGVVHTRNSKSRVYTHTVFGRPSYGSALERALDAGWDKLEAKNFAYYQKIASGNDPHPSRNFKAMHPDKWSKDDIAAETNRVDDQNRERVQRHRKLIHGHTVESFCEERREERVARVMELKQAGHYDKWQNLGWCGRRDLAVKLQAKETGNGFYTTVVIVEASLK